MNAVIKGLGISVLPRRMVTGAVQKGSVYTAQVEGIEFHREFYVVYHKDKRLTKLLKDFVTLCKNYELNYPLPRYQGLF